jgi:hypothetical protein
VKCKEVSSNIRIDPSLDLGNKFRRDAELMALSSGRQVFRRVDTADRSVSCENKQDSPFRQPYYNEH